MEICRNQKWMYNRLLSGQRKYIDKFLNGLEEFINFACQQPKYRIEGVIRCPCKLYKNEKHLAPDLVNIYIHQKGFSPKY